MRAILTKSLVRNALLLGAVGVACVAAPQMGCSSSDLAKSGALGQDTDPTPSGDGSVGMRLTLPGGSQLNTVSWIITGGPTGATSLNPVQSNTVNVTNSLSVSFSIGGLPAGSGYLITLSGTTTNGQTSCSGSAPFTVQSQATTSVSVQLACSNAAPDAGSAAISANTFDCATVQSLSAVPTEVIVGNPVSVTATATGPNPAALTYAWTAPSGSFSAPGSQTSNFTCSVAGSIPLTVTVTDGAVPSGSTCPTSTTSTVNVQCDGHLDAAQAFPTTTKIKHLIVIFGENISFDHYFGTYPTAQNNPGDTPFYAASGTPTPNNLVGPLNAAEGAFTPLTGVNLLTNNPTAQNSANGASAINPFRLSAEFAETSSQNHNYLPEQEAADNGRMDLYPEFTGTKGPPPPADAGAPAATQTTGLVMAYYDGNTLGTYWGYAQNYAINDNAFTTNFGPSTPGAINVISGQTNGVTGSASHPASAFSTSHATPDGNGGYTLIGDIDPLGDTCSTATDQGTMGGENIGTLLNTQNITWGWFNGGFNLGLTNSNSTTGCHRSTPQTVPFSTTSSDYVPHHQPFQYYASTANLTHARPASVASVGYSVDSDGGVDPANHQYDSQDFFAALSAGNLPAVVYLKAPAYQDGHPGNSNPVDEQNFAASVISALQQSQEWASSAVVVTYDDSDGWYDHQAPSIVNESTGVADALNGAGLCNSGVQQQADGGAATTMLNGIAPADGGAPAPALGRCAYGTRIPLMVVSPFAKHNYVDHTLVDQSSVVRFIEDNWLQSARIPGSFDAIAGTLQNMLTGD
jgi:phospholipase C